MKNRYTLTTVDPLYRHPEFTQTMSFDEAREFVNYIGVTEGHKHPWKWTLTNAKGFVVAAFDSLRMFGTPVLD